MEEDEEEAKEEAGRLTSCFSAVHRNECKKMDLVNVMSNDILDKEQHCGLLNQYGQTSTSQVNESLNKRL